MQWVQEHPLRISIIFDPWPISLNFVPKGPPMVKIMALRRPGDKPLSEPMMVSLPTHICVVRPQWVNSSLRGVSVLIYQLAAAYSNLNLYVVKCLTIAGKEIQYSATAPLYVDSVLYYSGLFSTHWLTLMYAWISNYSLYKKCEMK